MGKKKIDKLKLIESRTQRNVAFCKRKRGFLKKAIELSCLCGQKILIIIYDEERGRVVQFSSEDDYQIAQAYKSIKRARQPDNPNNYEKFNNDDYARLEQVDFRSVRYKKKAVYGEDSVEMISELEGLDDMIDSQDEGREQGNNIQQDKDGDESIGQIVPKKTNKRHKADKLTDAIADPSQGQSQIPQFRNEKLNAPIEKGDLDGQIQEKAKFIGQNNKEFESKSLTSNESLWKIQEGDLQTQNQKVKGGKKQNQAVSINQMFSQAGKGKEGTGKGNIEAEQIGGQARTNQIEQKTNLFDADKIRSLGIKDLHTSKREEKSKRKMMQQNMNEQINNNNTTANYENPNFNDRYNRLEKEVEGILNQDMKQQQNVYGGLGGGHQQNMMAMQRYSPAQSTGNLSSNLIQQLQQQKNKEMSPQIQQLLQQRLKQQQTTTSGGTVARSQSQAMLQQLVQKVQNKSAHSSQKGSPNVPFNQMYNQGQPNKKSPLAAGSNSKISPGLNWPAHSRSPNQRGNKQSLTDQLGHGGINLQNMKSGDVKQIKSPGYGMQKQGSQMDPQNNFNLAQQTLAALYNQKGMPGELGTSQAHGLTPPPNAFSQGPGDLQGSLMQPAFAQLRAAQEALQSQQMKQTGSGPQQTNKDWDNQLSQINMSIANLVDALHKGQGDSTPAQALQDITSISKLIDNSLLSEALNFDGGNNNQFKAIAPQQEQPKTQQMSQQGLLDDFQSQILGQIIMNNYGQNAQRGNNFNASRNAAQNGGTPFFQPQDQPRGQVPGAAGSMPFGSMQNWNTANQQAQVQDMQRHHMQGQSYQPQSAQLKNYLQQHQDESNDLKSNFNLSPLLMGNTMKDSAGGGGVNGSGSIGQPKDEKTNKNKLQKQIAVVMSQINQQELLLQSNFDEGKLPTSIANLPMGMSDQDLQKYGLSPNSVPKQLGPTGQTQAFGNNGGVGGQGYNTTDKSPQLVANQFLNEHGDFDSNDLGNHNKYFNQ